MQGQTANYILSTARELLVFPLTSMGKSNFDTLYLRNQKFPQISTAHIDLSLSTLYVHKVLSRSEGGAEVQISQKYNCINHRFFLAVQFCLIYCRFYHPELDHRSQFLDILKDNSLCISAQVHREFAIFFVTALV
jgi:hypothetical protein